MSYRTLGLASLVILPLFGCAEGKTNFFPNDGGADGGKVSADGGAGDGGATASCGDLCAAAIAGGCSDGTLCANKCKADNKKASTAGCGDERAAYVDCGVAKGVLGCDSSGGVTLTSSCTTQKKALDSCLLDSSGSDAGSKSCTLEQPFDPNNATCNTCAENNCCAEWNACSDSTDCTDLLNCLAACSSTSTTCPQGCQQAHPSGNTIAQAAVQCTQNGCSVACNL